ncbi:hypothetical protein [Ottowia sp.]|uniref:hypothetical protein n=1 Tax=Ottowia sp. TaxID=1898956 RepID=UPI0025F5C7B8|nr:hypothetical protein [Ottowia sp.]MBK6616449.1 hypothetical protein [Ottowia sp.]
MNSQLAFMTVEALRFALARTALLLSQGSCIRIAAKAQPVPYKGSWDMVRLDWSTEPERAANWTPSTTAQSA